MNDFRIDLWAPGFGAGGGIQAFSFEVANALTEFDLNLLSYDEHSLKSKGALVSRVNSLKFALALYRSAMVRRPKLIFSTHINFGPVAVAVLRRLGTPYILVAHGIDIHPELSPSRKVALQRAASVVSVSKFTAKNVSQFMNIPIESIPILPNTVDDIRYQLGDVNTSLLRKFGIPDGRRLIFTVGRLSASERYKGYDIVIRAMPRILASVPSAHYVLGGRGDDSDRVRRLVREMNLCDRVTVTGFLSTEDLASVYRSVDVFAMPSTGEGFGIVYLEAMASGVPVLAGNRDGSVDALDDGNLGKLVDPLDECGVAEGIIQLLLKQGPSWWFEPAELRERMLQRFGREAFRQRLSDIVRNTISPAC